MAPTLHKLKQVAAKKRKAAGTASPAEGRAAAKVPRRADAGRVGARETDAGVADTGGATVVKPLRAKVLKKGGPKRADTKGADAQEAKTVGSLRIGEAAQPQAEAPVTEDAAKAGAGKEVEQGPPVGESPAPAPPIILLDLSPDGKTPSPMPKETDKAPAAIAATPVAALPPTGATAEAPLPAKEPEAAGSEAESASVGPTPREGRGIDPSFQSLLANHSRWATRVIEEASVAEVQEYLRGQGCVTFFREASVAHLWALNSLVALKDLWTLSDTAIEQAREEMVSLQVKAEKAAMALEDTRATLTGEVEVIRLRAEKAEYALEVAQRRAANELDNAQVAEEKQKAAEEKLMATEEKLVATEEKLMAAEQEVCVLKTQMSSASAETNAAKEATRQHITKIADLEAVVAEAQRRAIEAEKKGANAIEDYKKSAAFDDEVAESAALAYDAGFQDCKKKIQELYDLEDIEELKPDDVPEDDAPPSDAH